MVIALTPGTTWDYICDCDYDPPTDHDDEGRGTPKPDATVFHLRTLGYEAHLKVSDATLGTTKQGIETGQFDIRQGAYMDRVIRDGLAGWSNMKDVDGREVEYESIVIGQHGRKRVIEPSPESLGRIPQKQLVELCSKIVEGNQLGAGDQKN